MQKRTTCLFTIALLCVLIVSGVNCTRVFAWSNGGYSGDPANPGYGTHDWIAQHALDWLPAEEKQFLTDNLAWYLYGTELPDNRNTPDGVGDTTKHHIYFFANGSLQDDAAAVRAEAEFVSAQQFFHAGNLSAAAEHLGMVAHYLGDMSVFGHMMGASTAWGTEVHHSDYESYVLRRTESYVSELDSYLVYDGNLTLTTAYDGAVGLARDTTFDLRGGGLNCTWMDQHYNWSDATFRNRMGASLNLAVNAVADVIYTFYIETAAPSQTSTTTPTLTASSTPTPSASSTPQPTPTSTTPVPEFPSTLTMTLIMMTISAGVLLYTKKKTKNQQHFI